MREDTRVTLTEELREGFRKWLYEREHAEATIRKYLNRHPHLCPPGWAKTRASTRGEPSGLQKLAPGRVRGRQRELHAGLPEPVPALIWAWTPGGSSRCGSEKPLSGGRKGADERGIPESGAGGAPGREGMAGPVHGDDGGHRHPDQRAEIFHRGERGAGPDRDLEQGKAPQDLPAHSPWEKAP